MKPARSLVFLAVVACGGSPAPAPVTVAPVPTAAPSAPLDSSRAHVAHRGAQVASPRRRHGSPRDGARRGGRASAAPHAPRRRARRARSARAGAVLPRRGLRDEGALRRQRRHPIRRALALRSGAARFAERMLRRVEAGRGRGRARRVEQRRLGGDRRLAGHPGLRCARARAVGAAPRRARRARARRRRAPPGRVCAARLRAGTGARRRGAPPLRLALRGARRCRPLGRGRGERDCRRGRCRARRARGALAARPRRRPRGDRAARRRAEGDARRQARDLRVRAPRAAERSGARSSASSRRSPSRACTSTSPRAKRSKRA